MAVEYQEIRTELEADGFRLDDEEYTEAVNYARRKAKSSGKDESYMPYNQRAERHDSTCV